MGTGIATKIILVAIYISRMVRECICFAESIQLGINFSVYWL